MQKSYHDMITGEIKNKIDQIWDVFFVAGITSPIAVLEQMTYIFFMKLHDDKQIHVEGLLAFLPKIYQIIFCKIYA